MTLRDLFRELVIAKRQNDDAHDQKVTLVWLGEALHRQKRLTDVKTLLTKRQLRPQTHKQMTTMLYQLGERYGLTVRKKARRG